MSILVVGLSHNSAPIEVLERASLNSEAANKLAVGAIDSDFVNESAVIATCNRVEVYVDADRFHGAVERVCELLCDQAEIHRNELFGHVYVHYDEAAVEHLFTVASGLDSMVIGEPQILGQVRQTLAWGQREGTVGASLNALFQQALRIGKRGHAETGIDRLGASVVDAGFAAAGGITDEAYTSYLIAGAGSMAGLSTKTLIGAGVQPTSVTVTNRTLSGARELADNHGIRAVSWDELDKQLEHADVLVCATGSTGTIFDAAMVSAARAHSQRPLTIIDLALPRDVDRAVADLNGVTVIDLEVLRQSQPHQQLEQEVEQVRQIVSEEVTAFLQAKESARVTPTVVALRSMATQIVDAELERVRSRLNRISSDEFKEVEQAVRRVADKLLHGPTVRVQELDDNQPGLTYADALADLFSLDPATVNAVSRIKGDAQ